MNKNKTQEQIIVQFQQKADTVIMKMFHALTRAQRKIDDIKYRTELKKYNL